MVQLVSHRCLPQLLLLFQFLVWQQFLLISWRWSEKEKEEGENDVSILITILELKSKNSVLVCRQLWKGLPLPLSFLFIFPHLFLSFLSSSSVSDQVQSWSRVVAKVKVCKYKKKEETKDLSPLFLSFSPSFPLPDCQNKGRKTDEGWKSLLRKIVRLAFGLLPVCEYFCKGEDVCECVWDAKMSWRKGERENKGSNVGFPGSLSSWK